MPSHYVTSRWLIVNGNKFQRDSNQNKTTFIQENEFAIVAKFQMAVILSRPQSIEYRTYSQYEHGGHGLRHWRSGHGLRHWRSCFGCWKRSSYALNHSWIRRVLWYNLWLITCIFISVYHTLTISIVIRDIETIHGKSSLHYVHITSVTKYLPHLARKGKMLNVSLCPNRNLFSEQKMPCQISHSDLWLTTLYEELTIC